MNNENLIKPLQIWEYFKMNCQKILKFQQKSQQGEETKLIKDLFLNDNKLCWSPQDKEIIDNLQSKLDKHYLNKAQGSHIKSRARWIEATIEAFSIWKSIDMKEMSLIASQ